MEGAGAARAQLQNLADIEEPMDTDQGSEDIRLRARFKQHSLSISRKAGNVVRALDEQCVICLEPFGDPASRQLAPMSVLTCYHVFHEGCIKRALEDRDKCPECRAQVTRPLDEMTYQNKASLIASLPLECSEPQCEIADNQYASVYQCPYPRSLFTHWQPEQFLENNQHAIMHCLNYLLQLKQYSYCNPRYIPNSSHGQGGCITLNVKTAPDPDQPQRSLFYSSEEVNRGRTAQECYDNFMNDVKTDMAMLDFQTRYPGAFMQRKRLYITEWAFHENKVKTSTGLCFALDAIIDPATKEISVKRLRDEAARVGLNADELLSSPLSLPLHFRVLGGF